MMNRLDIVNSKLKELSYSKFRSSFHLTKKDMLYIEKHGLEKICQDAYEIINKRLSPKIIANDGKQTPFHGHPVFISEHATATCCRGCLFKWHHIPKDRKLTTNEVNYIVAVIMAWIIKEKNQDLTK